MAVEILCMIILIVTMDESVNTEKVNDYFHIYQKGQGYSGEKFPDQYMNIESVVPTQDDFIYYIDTLFRVYDYFASQLNETDPNIGLGCYLSKAVLKRVLLDYGDKIREKEKLIIKNMISKAEDVVSHFIWDCKSLHPGDLGHGLSDLFKYDDSLVVSMEKYNRNGLQKWLTTDLHLNEYTERFDNMSLPKDLYAELVIDMDKQYKVIYSDTCICQIATLPIPIRMNDDVRDCHFNKFCEREVLKMPSVAYSVSHRLLYVVLVALARRCYIVSEAVDRMHMDIMCANMYRETVYLARRGYFYRDLFLEHIAICSLLGYEEFQRPRWFKKTASWIDEDGCMEENRNFELNRTRIYISRQENSRARKTMKRLRRMHMNEECAHHQMVLATNVLAYGIRHAAHYMPSMV